ncbi:MAG: hypothetical protein Q7R30_13050, partial [Acidobacteriota bacterium]|nr:hypothetical protein [Acidobacteriota bacterium]
GEVDLRESHIWELHFSGCEFGSALTFKGATGRISFQWFSKTPSLLDISGMKMQGSDLSLPRFKGSLLAVGTEFEGSLDLSDAETDYLDLSNAIFRKNLTLVRATVKNDCSLAGAVCDGAVDLTGFDAFSGFLDLSNMAIARPEEVRLIRVNRRRASPPLRLFLGSSNIDGARIADVQWNREGGRLRLEDEREVADGRLSPAQASLTYRRLSEPLESSHWYEEADDCLSAAMEMRRRDTSLGWPARLFLLAYRISSFYGSSYWRAATMLVVLVFIVLAPAFGFAGLTYGAYRPDVVAALPQQQQATRGPVRGTNSMSWLVRSYGRGLVHALEIGSLRDSTSFRPVSAAGVILESTARLLVPAQFAALLLALRRRFTRS